MAKFSERYGYTKVSNIIIREQITPPIINGIVNWLDLLKDDEDGIGEGLYVDIDYTIWEDYFHERTSEYRNKYSNSYVIDTFIVNGKHEWFEILNLLERFILMLRCIEDFDQKQHDKYLEDLNCIFIKHNFAYRVIGGCFEEITSDEEIKSIAEAIATPVEGVQTHLNEALKLLSPSNETPNYRNSIKESISAVEALGEMITEEKTLGKSLSLSTLEKKGIIIPANLREGARKLYDYTNDNTTGIRHTSGDITNSPTADEAIYMLVACSAFINYLKKKI